MLEISAHASIILYSSDPLHIHYILYANLLNAKFYAVDDARPSITCPLRACAVQCIWAHMHILADHVTMSISLLLRLVPLPAVSVDSVSVILCSKSSDVQCSHGLITVGDYITTRNAHARILHLHVPVPGRRAGISSIRTFTDSLFAQKKGRAGQAQKAL